MLLRSSTLGILCPATCTNVRSRSESVASGPGCVRRRNGALMRVQQPRHRFVRLHHEHLDQRVRERLILRHRIDHLPLIIEHQLHRRQIQHDLPILPPPLLHPPRQRVHVMQQLHHVRRIIRQPLVPIRMRNLLLAIDNRLRLPIPQPLGAGDHRIGKPSPNRPRIRHPA